MFLKNLKLTNFRNYSKLDFKFKTPITILYGNNAQGKTNFLEAVYFLATAKSTRADRDEEVIREGEEVVRVSGEVGGESEESRESEESKEVKNVISSDSEKSPDSGKDKSGDFSTVSRNDRAGESVDLEIAMQLQEDRLMKRVKVNGLPKRVLDYSQNLAVVYFAPEDINLVKGAPSLRRDHLDSIICQVDREYKQALNKYEEVITKKNRVLKAIRDEFASLDQLTFWVDQQIHFGEVLTQKRQEFFSYINSLEKKFGEFNFEYVGNLLSLERLREYQNKEIESANSLIGPHRDDFRFLLGERGKGKGGSGNASGGSEGRDLAKYGSRGEQRTAVMVLKLNEINFMEQVLKTRPLLLLDDIFSELDDDHKKYVFEIAKLQQSIISTVEIDEHLKEFFEKDAKIYEVKDGKIA
jgi:DNA replication and repair protein RecF